MRLQKGVEAIKAMPLKKILIESGSPYCDIHGGNLSLPLLKTIFPRISAKYYRPMDERFIFTIIKYRNEPCMLVNVIEALSVVKNT
jgi:Tat protein secretion system quality control protein TatD with DNase activity